MPNEIYVFCNSCKPQWHHFKALSEDGVFLADHLCSDHGYAPYDMGINENGWQREIYTRHYPDGFQVLLVEATDPRVAIAYEKHLAIPEEEYKARLAVLRAEPATQALAEEQG